MHVRTYRPSTDGPRLHKHDQQLFVDIFCQDIVSATVLPPHVHTLSGHEYRKLTDILRNTLVEILRPENNDTQFLALVTVAQGEENSAQVLTGLERERVGASYQGPGLHIFVANHHSNIPWAGREEGSQTPLLSQIGPEQALGLPDPKHGVCHMACSPALEHAG